VDAQPRFSPYQRFRAVGDYNGKFVSGAVRFARRLLLDAGGTPPRELQQFLAGARASAIRGLRLAENA
jgi:hypothetical protein